MQSAGIATKAPVGKVTISFVAGASAMESDAKSIQYGGGCVG